MNEFETFYRQQIERLERELKRAKSDKERESIERELAVYRGALEQGKREQRRIDKARKPCLN